MQLKILASVAVLAAGLCVAVMAQQAPPDAADGVRAGRGPGANFHGVGGQITAIEGSTITLQTFSGESAKVHVTSSTRLIRDRVEAKFSDFKVGDRVFASGEQGKHGAWTAQFLAQRGGTGPRGENGARQKPEDNGKTYISGEITRIEGTTLTIRKPDNAEEVIEVNDETAFRNGRESVTFADVKVGDFVRGQGALKNGIFVLNKLNAGRPRGARQGAVPPGVVPQNQSQPAPSSSDQK